MELKIGLLLPRSDMFPSLSLDFLNGLKLVFSQHEHKKINPKIIIEGIGNAADDITLRIAEKMILQEEVDLVVSFCSFFQLKELTTIFNAYKKPLIHLDLGGNVIKKEHTSTYVLHHTLGLWQSAYASGLYAAKTFGKKAALTASFYDGGYQLVASFVKGFVENGGEIVSNYVSPMDYKTETYETMIEGIQKSNPDVIFSLFSYKEGIKVFDVLSKSKLNGTVPIMALSLMTDETINTVDYHIENVFSIASWSFEDTDFQMKNFIKEYRVAYETDPNIIGLMGYEVGLILLESNSNEGKLNPKICDALKNKIIDSPRGELSFNTMNESQSDSFKLRKFNFDNNKYHNTVIETIDASFSENLYSEFEDIPYTGWKNPYICT